MEIIFPGSPLTVGLFHARGQPQLLGPGSQGGAPPFAKGRDLKLGGILRKHAGLVFSANGPPQEICVKILRHFYLEWEDRLLYHYH
jgi:hypothetical protein